MTSDRKYPEKYPGHENCTLQLQGVPIYTITEVIFHDHYIDKWGEVHSSNKEFETPHSWEVDNYDEAAVLYCLDCDEELDWPYDWSLAFREKAASEDEELG